MRGRLQKTGYLPGLTAELLPLRPRALPGNSLRAQHREDWDGSHSHPSPLRNAFWGRVKRSPSRPSVLPAEWGWRRVSGSTEAQVQQAGGFTWKWTDGWRERPRQPKRLQLNLKSFLRACPRGRACPSRCEPSVWRCHRAGCLRRWFCCATDRTVPFTPVK